MTTPAPWKVDEVNDLSKLIKDGEISALVGIHGIRNRQLQSIRKGLRGTATLKVVRSTLLHKALDGMDSDAMKQLKEAIHGQVALLSANMSPTKLYETILSTVQDSAAKGGEIAPDDIVIEAKETQFPPGPMVSEFQKVGLQTAIEKGKIVIKKDTVFVHKGEVISKDKAKILEKLEIHPLKVGLELLGAYSDGLYYPKEVLSETITDILNKFVNAYSRAKAIASEAMFIVTEIVPELIIKARLGAENLALSTGFVDEANIQLFILKAIKDAAVLKGLTEGEREPQKAEEKKEEKKEEEQKSPDEDISAGLGSLFG